MSKSSLKEKAITKEIFKHEKEKEREHLLRVLKNLEESLKECKEGNCLNASSFDELKECLYDSNKICLRRTSGSPLFCEWLKKEITFVKEKIDKL